MSFYEMEYDLSCRLTIIRPLKFAIIPQFVSNLHKKTLSNVITRC